jgi:hypothetical protein
MRIALCIGNLASKGKQGRDAYIKGFNHLKNKIINRFQNVDVFLHSYEIELKNELLALYNPVDSIFELSPDFSQFYKNLNHSYTKDCDISPTFSYPNLFSMAYSRYLVGKLKKKYENEKKIKYDWVIFARYDISSANHISDIYFDLNYDNNFIYSCMFSQLNAGPNDQWFFSSSENMDIIFSLYKKINEYFTEDSDFLKSCINNWIDSNKNDRFSCEILCNNDTKTQGEKIPISRIANGHLIYKWHFFSHNFWNLKKLMFIVPKKQTQEFSKFIGHPNIVVEK